jgi:hypothetical protein
MKKRMGKNMKVVEPDQEQEVTGLGKIPGGNLIKVN